MHPAVISTCLNLFNEKEDHVLNIVIKSEPIITYQVCRKKDKVMFIDDENGNPVGLMIVRDEIDSTLAFDLSEIKIISVEI